MKDIYGKCRCNCRRYPALKIDAKTYARQELVKKRHLKAPNCYFSKLDETCGESVHAGAFRYTDKSFERFSTADMQIFKKGT